MKSRFGLLAVVSILVIAGLVFALKSDNQSPTGRGDSAKPLLFYCAAGIRRPIEQIIKEYEQQYGVTIQTKYAGSGALLSDLRAGGGDLYLAADTSYLSQARREKQVHEIIDIASQSPALAVAKGNPKGIHSLADLKRDGVELSLADPEIAAISRVARRLLKKNGQWDVLWKRKDVTRSTVNEVANDLKLGTTDAGIIWDATAAQYDEIETVPISELSASPNQIAIGVLESSAQPTRALHFARYLSARDRGLKSFAKYGYQVADGDLWAEKPELLVFSGGLDFPAIEPTLKEFKLREGVDIVTVANGCGILVGQMKTGARPDMYVSCDISFMSQVRDLFFDAVNVSRTDMVIVTQKGNPHGIKTLADLGKTGLKIALCDPQKSALGKLTDDLLKKKGLREKVRANLRVTAPTAAELMVYIVNGQLDAAVVYRANTSHERSRLEIITIGDPDAMAVQPVAVGRKSKYPHLARRLMEQILSAKSRPNFDKLGFEWIDRAQGTKK